MKGNKVFNRDPDFLVIWNRWTALLRHPPPVSPATLHLGAEVGGVAPDGTPTAKLLGDSEAQKESTPAEAEASTVLTRVSAPMVWHPDTTPSLGPAVV